MKETFYERIGEAVCRERLTNGLEVCVVPKPGYAKKYAFFSTRYGGMDTRFCLDGQWLNTPAGIAHYLEHKMFDTREGNALQELAKNGAEPNAFTSNAMTAYYFDSTEHFEENLRILLSFVSIPYFTDESVAKEQGIIGQEIRMIEDNPDWQIYTRMLRAMYHRHAARTSIAGTVESIAEITADTLYDCHKAFYTPANMILTVVGDVDPVHVIDLANRVLPKLSGPIIERDYGTEPETVAEKETVLEMEVSAPQFLAGFKCAPAAEGDDYMRASILGDMASDILMGESISARTNQLAYYVPLEYVSGDGKSLDQKKYAAYTGISESTLKGYLNSSRQVVPYYFPGGVYYYLNFNSEKSANDFFSEYYANNQGKTAQYANIYLDEDALIVDSNTIMTFSGDILKRAASADMLEVGTYTIAPDNWKDSSGLYWKYCSKLAVRYKSLELGLTDQGQGVTEDNVRLTSTDASGHEVIDKTVNPLFDYLIDRSAFTTEVEKHKASPTASETVYSPAADVYLIENAGTYALPATVTKGIVIATGDVRVSGQFEGMIISGGVISFDSNASVRGNKLLVSQLFTEDQKRDTPLFSQFFKGCSSLAASNISGNLDLDSYLNYDNWKKNG